MPVATPAPIGAEPFTGYTAACRAADVLEEARKLAGQLGSSDHDPACQRMSALLAISDGYRQLADTIGKTPNVFRPPPPPDDTDPRVRR